MNSKQKKVLHYVSIHLMIFTFLGE